MFIKSIPGPGAGDRKSRKPRAPRPRVLIRHGISKGLSAGCAPSPCVCARCSQARGQLQVPQVRSRRCEGTSSFPRGSSTEEAACQCRRHKRCGFDPWVGKIPLRRAWQPTPVFLPVGFPWTEEPDGLQPWGRKESDTTEATQHAFQTVLAIGTVLVTSLSVLVCTLGFLTWSLLGVDGQNSEGLEI